MKDKHIPKPVGEPTSEPISFPRKDEVYKRLDEFYKTSKIPEDISASDMLRGALYAMRQKNRKSNPDWMAQVAHSLREILYQFQGDWKPALEEYGSTLDKDEREKKVGRYYGFMCAVAHHNLDQAGINPIVGGSRDNQVEITPELFESKVLQFGEVIFVVLRRQVDAHSEIDLILEGDTDEARVDRIKELVNLNRDAQQYFYSQADEKWLEWLWENGFLDVIKEKAEDPTKYSYTPELHYLSKVADDKPAKVVEIVNSVPISEDNFNPEVIDQFLRICSSLHARHLKKVVPKIRDENWVKLMDSFNRRGYEYKDMLETLAESKEYDSILMLAEVLFTIRRKEEINKSDYVSDSPFYIDDLSYTKLFQFLSSMEGEHAVQAFVSITRVAKEIILLGDKTKDESAFELQDKFPLYDVDFFEINPGEGRSSARENVKQLFAVFAVLARKVIGERCDDSNEIKKLYEKYISSLPNSQASWRFRLLVLSLCPKVFKEELQQALNRIFEVQKYNSLLTGAEYYKDLALVFPEYSRSEKRDFIDKTLKFFSKKTEEDEDDWHKRYGWRILSSIGKYLTEEEKKNCKELFGRECEDEYEPEPDIGRIRGGTVSPIGPISQEEFDELEVEQIVERLKGAWSPEELYKQYKDDDFRRPRNAEGAATLIKNSISTRMQDFVDNAELFFDRDSLSPHYTYSYLRGIEETVKQNKGDYFDVNWNGLIQLLLKIKKGEEKKFSETEFEKEEYGSWTASWTAIHNSMADIVEELLRQQDGSSLVDFDEHRDKFLKIIEYLLSYPEPTLESEEPETATHTVKRGGSRESKVSDPFSKAINSVRGRAFQAFVIFVYRVGKTLSQDVKELYKSVLDREDTRAIMFMFGHYLPTFYYRDEKWIRSLISEIFPKDPEKEYLYLAAWEGYLSNNLYKKVFFDTKFQEFYERGIKDIKEIKAKESHREFFKDPQESLAVHLALAHMYYEDFDNDHSLYKLFWEEGTKEQHAAFISFIGRMFIFGNDESADKLISNESWPKKRLKELWSNLLENYDDPEIFEEFGSWMSLEKDIFKPDWLATKIKETLEKTGGSVEWEYEFVKSMPKLAEANLKESVRIAELYLNNLISEKKYFHLQDEWMEVMRIIYQNEETRSEVETLINQLIEKGGRPFWNFKKVLDTNSPDD